MIDFNPHVQGDGQEEKPVQPEESKAAGGEEDLSIHIGREEMGVEQAQMEMAEQEEEKSWSERLNEGLVGFTSISGKEVATFFRLMAVMQNAGITILKSVNIMAKQTTNARFARVLREFVHRIEGGTNFSECMKEYPDIFNEASVGMVASGESSGRLNKVLVSIADMMEKSQKLRGKIIGAMVYPVAVLVLMFFVGVVVMIMIVPKFKDMFGQLGSELPFATQLLIGISDWVVAYWFWVLAAPFVLVALVRLITRTEVGRYYWDYLMLSIPVFGVLNRKVALSRFASSLAALSEAGINIDRALEINAHSIGNHVYRDRILKIRDDVEQGVMIAENIKNDTFLFPDIVVSMIDVGEQTATINKVAAKVSEFYDEEVDNAVKNLTTAMEPAIIVVLGVGVGIFVMAIFQPIFQLSDLIQNA